MATFTKALKELFNPKQSSISSFPSRNGNKRTHEDGNISNANAPTRSLGATGAAAARRAGKRDNGIMTSALWAVARTPVLVEAVERVEARYNEEVSPLCLVLSKLRTRTDDDAAEAADAFLRANPLPTYDHMEPMEAIRAIIGLSADSEQVLEEAASTTYRTTIKCNLDGCRFSRETGSVNEEQLECKNPKAQLHIELRATSSKKDLPCELCKRKGVAKRYILDKPAPCLVATWSSHLMKADSGQEHLFLTAITASFEQFRFKLGVMIVYRGPKFVCMFREGPNFYRVEGKSVKLTAIQEWKSAQPCLALFNLQGAPGDKSPRSQSPRGTTLRCPASNGGRRAGRKRQRQQMGYGQLSEGSGSSSSRARGAVGAAEVIEVDDDDDSDRGAADTSQPAVGGAGGGEADADDRPNGDNDGGGAGVSGEDGAAATGSGGKGKRKSRDGEREAEEKPPLRQAVDVDDSNACEEVLLADKPAGRAATGGEGGSGAGATVAGLQPPPAAPAAATPARRKRTARDGGGGAGSSPAATMTSFRRQDQEAPSERDRREDPVGPPHIPSFSDGSRCGSWMGQDGTPCEASADSAAGSARNCSGRSPSLASGTTASSARQRPRYTDEPDGATRAGGGHADLTAEARADSRMDVDDEDDDIDDDVQLVESSLRREEGGRRSPAVSSPSCSAATAGAGGGSSGGSGSSGSGAVSGGPPTKSTSDSTCQSDSEKDARGAVSGGALDSPREREVHDVDDDDDDDDDDAPPTDPIPAISNGKKHPSGVPMPFIGPPRPPQPLIGPAPPPQSKPDALPPRVRPLAQQRTSDVPWLSRNKDEEARKKAAAAARANRGARKAGGGGSSGAGGQQSTIPSSWKKTSASSNGALANGGSGSGSSGGGSSLGKPAQRRPPGNGATFFGAGGGSGSGCGGSGSGSGSGGGGNSSRQGGLRSRGEKVTEDLTGADDSWQEVEDAKGSSVGRGRSSAFVGGAGGDATLTTIRGINLQHDHFDRILDSDGWLTSQIIDIRVKQLQELHPQNLYFDTSFFGFLCPSTERGGAFVVDYERVKGWTKASRLPAGKSSVFDMQKLFIPINQGNVHWVLVVVDMNGGGGGGGGGGGSSSRNSSSAKTVSFFDSFGRDGTTYVEAVQQYLVSELSHRDKARQEQFAPRTRPLANAPRQHNSSDCGVLMLHVMEELSNGPASDLTRLTQEEIMSLRLQLVAKIRE